MKAYPAYRLTGPAGQRPTDLHRHLALYGVACTVKAYDVCADGSYRSYFYRTATGDDRVRLGSLLAAGLARAVGAVTALALNAINWRYGLGKEEAVEAQVEVRLLVDGTFDRDAWAELILCKYAVREGWSIRPADGRRWIAPANLRAAQRNPRAPIPLSRVRGWGAARRVGL